MKDDQPHVRKRNGADYYVSKPYTPAPYARWQHGWRRRTSSGWMQIEEPKTYKPHNADNHMRLAVGPAPLTLNTTTGTIPPAGMAVWLVRDHFDLPEAAQVIAEGSLKDLWELFLQHGRMVLTE